MKSFILMTAGVIAGVAVAPAAARSPEMIYDVNMFLRQPHPFAHAGDLAMAGTAAGPGASAGEAVATAATAGGSARIPLPDDLAQAPQSMDGDEEEEEEGLGGILSEVRVGVLAHDTGPFGSSKEEGIDTNLELLFTSPDFLEAVWSPRPHLGGTINSAGDTSQVYLGLTWGWNFWDAAFLEFSWGGALHDGKLKDSDVGAANDRKALGCSVLFRESFALGYQFSDHYDVMLHLDHISNGRLCDFNEGIDNLGLRVGYKF